jgi:hypothetical protein
MANTAMRFVPQQGESSYISGAATVTVLPDSKVKICYLDKYDTTKNPPELKSKGAFSDGTQCKIFEFSELPMQFSTEDEGVEATLRVVSEGSKVLEFLPWNESGLKGRFVEFTRSNGKGTDPIPFEKKKFQEDNPDVMQFGAIYKIEGGMFDGKEIAQYLQFSQAGKAKKSGKPYSFSTFTKDEDGNVALGFQPLPNGSTGYKWSDQIYDLRHCGLLEGSAIVMPEDGNPLKAIEQKLQQANKLVEIEVAKGYVVSLASAKKLGTFQKQAEPLQVTTDPITTNPDVM